MRVGSIVLVLAAGTGLAAGKANGVGELPPLGWNTWCTWASCDQDPKIWPNLTSGFHDVCTEAMVMNVAQSMLDQGLHGAGYNRVHLDDCWEATTRDPSTGAMRADPARFPSGSLKPLADWLHARGFLFGMYTSLGNQTCSTGGRTVPGNPTARGVPGSYGHYQQDADTYAEWGVDYVKLDSCVQHGDYHNSTNDDVTRAYLTPRFSQALDRTTGNGGSSSRKIWLNFHCNGAFQPWCSEWGNSWRIAKDHHDIWENTAKVIEALATASQNNQTGRDRWADADFLMTGGAGCDHNETGLRCPGQTELEYRTEFSLWAIGASAILVATDLRSMTPFMTATLLNKGMIAIHQDPLAIPGGRVGYAACSGGGDGGRGGGEATVTDCQVWARPLAGGDLAVGLYNAGGTPHNIDVNITALWGESCVDEACRGLEMEMPANATAARTPAPVRTKVVDVWRDKDLGFFDKTFSALNIRAHETQVFRLSRA